MSHWRCCGGGGGGVFPSRPWIEERRALLASGASLDLFEGHPDGEFKVQVCGGTGAPLGWIAHHVLVR